MHSAWSQPLPHCPVPTRRGEAWRREPLQGWAQAPILGAESASCLHLPAAVRLNRRPAWGRNGIRRDPSLPKSDLSLRQNLLEHLLKHRWLGLAPEFLTQWVWRGLGICISGKFPAEFLVWGPHFESH